MRRLTYLLLTIFLISFPVICPSAEVYMWVDEKGVSHITDQPPEKPTKIIGKETYKKDSPAEIQRYQAGEKAKEKKRDAELLQRQQANRAEEAARKAQEQERRRAEEIAAGRNARADKLERDAQERLDAVRRSGITLPLKNIRMLEGAAKAKAEQIRAGTDKPMTEQEDREFHESQERFDRTRESMDTQWKINSMETKIRELETDRLRRY